jgi:ABC-type polysaccharide/polyol phosphate transport system, ATPase component
MSSDIIISARNLCKTYRAYAHSLDRLIPGRTGRYKEFHALRDVSFDIRRGETVGIIGRNGSGKSTLLQLICGIRKPTSGTLEVQGRISALLELGAGFHPEFTGRENVFMQGAIMGLSQSEMEARFADIAAFADIGEYLDQPVKTYSSGMFVRLAFAVAVSVEPDILVVDEALAVGDMRFQSTCFQRINDIRNGGGTILFVSHATDQVVRICDRAILMDTGQKLIFWVPKQVVGMYQKLVYAPPGKKEAIREMIQGTATLPPEGLSGGEVDNTRQLLSNETIYTHTDVLENYDSELTPKSTIEYGLQGAFIESPELRTVDDLRVNNVVSGESYRFVYTVRFAQEVTNVRFGMLIKTGAGVELGGASTAANLADSIPVVCAGTRVSVVFQFKCILNPGIYFLNAGVTGVIDGVETILHRILDAEMFRVASLVRSTSTAIVDFGCIPRIQVTSQP